MADQRVLKLRMKGDDVAKLQYQLQKLGYAIDSREIEDKGFGKSTQKAVLTFQQQHNLEVDGIAGQKTFTAIARVLDELEHQEPDDENEKRFIVRGEVRQADGLPLAGATVRAFDRDLRHEQLLGESSTDDAGRYEIRYTEKAFRRAEKLTADLIVRVFDGQGQELVASDIIFNAGQVETVDLMLGGGNYAGPSEYERLMAELAPLLENVPLSELTEEDVSFLAGETGIEAQQITWLAEAGRLGIGTKLPPEVFYGFARKQLPTSLPALLANDRQILRTTLESAIDENIIPMRLQDSLDGILERLAELAVDQAFEKPAEEGKYSLGELLEAGGLAKSVQKKFVAFSSAYQGPPDQFWQTLGETPGFTAKTVESLQLTTRLGHYTDNHVPMAKLLQKQIQDGTIKSARELARLVESDWIKLTDTKIDGKKVGVPPDTEGKSSEEKAANYAEAMMRKVELDYPTAAVAYAIEREETGGALEGRDDLILFFRNNNPSFDFASTKIDAFVTENPGVMKGVSDVPGTIDRLKTLQRLYSISPAFKRYDVMFPLMQQGVDSAHKVVLMGEDPFVHGMSEWIGEKAARDAFHRAANVSAVTQNLMARFGARFNGPTPAVISSPPAEVEGIANWEELFGPLSFCQCEHCRSLYSPAAYLTDLLHFLDQGPETDGKTPLKLLCESNGRGGASPSSPLKRRPDILETKLSCANTNTVMPYVDLVNEVLENAVSPMVFTIDATAGNRDNLNSDSDPLSNALKGAFDSHGYPLTDSAEKTIAVSGSKWRIEDGNLLFVIGYETGSPNLIVSVFPQTTAPAEELAANPEHINGDAYDALASANYPFTLPFNLWAEEAGVYLEHLGVSRYQLIEAFQASPDDDLIAGEYLKLTDAERGIIAPSSPPPTDTWEFWGLNEFPDPTSPADNWVKHLEQVDTFLARSGLEFAELEVLLDTNFINDGRTMAVNFEADPCDIHSATISGLTDEVLAKIHRFIRLWRKLDLSISELDRSLSVLGFGALDGPFLTRLANMLRLQKMFHLPVDELLSWWGNMDALPTVSDGQSLYGRVFRNRSVIKLQPGEVDPFDPDSLAGTVGDHISAIIAALNISEEEFGLLKASELTDDSLSLENLTKLYRAVSLSRALRLPVRDLLSVKAITDIDPFTAGDPGATRLFVEAIAKIQNSGFTVDELNYLLRHTDNESGSLALPADRAARILDELRLGLQAVAQENMPLPDPTGEITREKLISFLVSDPSLSKEEKLRFTMALLEQTAAAPSGPLKTEQESFIASQFAGLFDDEGGTDPDIDSVSEAQDKLTGAGFISDRVDRYAYFLKHLLHYLRKVESKRFVIQKLGGSLSLETSMAEALLGHWVKVPGSTADSSISEFLKQTLVDYPDEITESDLTGSFDAMFKILVLLDKAARLVNRYGIETSALPILFDDGSATALFNLNSLPSSDSDAPADFTSWEKLADLFAFRDRALVGSHSLVEILKSTTPFDRNDYLDILSQATGWDRQDLSELAGTNGLYLTDAELKEPRKMLLLNRAFDLLKRLGVSAVTVLNPDPTGASWVSANITLDVSRSIKQAAKAKHDDSAWRKIVKPLRDALRLKQRTALVDYLVWNRREEYGFTDADDLYAFFLIDVEMEPCMMTSRIKQAIGSVQLFIQRCLMDLESDVDLSSSEVQKWKELWSWMKNYRVWEANRKVFLYPENWIEPELRDNKSPFFKDMENALLQNEVTEETVENAFLGYLEKLDEVANLEIMGLYQETDEETDILHVFGRTRNSPHIYFYRRWMNQSYWTPWERVDLDIEGDHLIPVVWNRRLYLFWAIFNEKAEEPDLPDSSDEPPSKPRKYWEIKLAWSEHKSQKWASKAMSDILLKFNEETFDLFGLSPMETQLQKSQFYFTASPQRAGHLQLFISFFVQSHAYSYQFSIVNAGASINFKLLGGLHGELHPPIGSEMSGMKYLEAPHELSGSETTEGGPLTLPLNSTEFATVLGYTPGTYSIAYKHQFYLRRGAFAQPFFFQTENRSFFVNPVEKNMPLPFGHRGLSVRMLQYSFRTFLHPYVSSFCKQINWKGIGGLLDPQKGGMESFLGRQLIYQDYFTAFEPNTLRVESPYPKDNVDFSYSSSYAIYNWELFFHVPLLIADRLMQNQRFDEAMRWFHYIFDPADVSKNSDGTLIPKPSRFWKVKPFFLNEDVDASGRPWSIRFLMNLLHYDGSDPEITQEKEEFEQEIREWKDDPFNPHLIARLRISPYMKTVVMKYLDNLIAWGDQLFRRDSIESINEATQLYILASEILGDRPQELPARQTRLRTYNELDEIGLSEFSNALENELAPALGGSDTGGGSSTSPTLLLKTLYYCIPNNEKLLKYWATVADRLFKIRHCMNIEGVVRKLPLFEPPIEPGLLVRARAAGVDINSAMSDLNAPLPHYRFQVMLQKAVDLCADVRSLGAALLSALEKKDAEAMSLLRSKHELQLLTEVREIKEKQIKEAEEALEGLNRSKAVIETRLDYYKNIKRINTYEKLYLQKLGDSNQKQNTAHGLELAVAGLALISEIDLGSSGWAATPVVKARFGGIHLSTAAQSAARVYSYLAQLDSQQGTMASIKGGYERRWDDWKLQERVASKELEQIDKQIAAAEIRLAIAEHDLRNHDRQIENAEEIDTFMRDKFTNKELYGWMVSQISTIYFQSYQLAYDIAKRAEKAYRHELGIKDTDSNFIRFGYWDSLKKGLLSGEKLHYDLKRMDASYLELNKREFELTKHVSVAMLNPVELLKLKETGECTISLPEAIFDLDHPGHYMRRIKSVSISVPCVTGPFAGVNCTLTLQKNSVRINTDLLAGSEPYERTYTGSSPDVRFRDDPIPVRSIATSSGQNDSGLFELNFRDERYLPFEGGGAISEWRLELPGKFRQFDYDTISDVIFHISYTARDGGDSLKNAAIGSLETLYRGVAATSGLMRFFGIRHEFVDEWSHFLNPKPELANPPIRMDIGKERFPAMFEESDIKIDRVGIFVELADGISTPSSVDFNLTKPDVSSDPISAAASSDYGEVLYGEVPSSGALDQQPGTWVLDLSSIPDELHIMSTAGVRQLNPEAIKDIGIVFFYHADPPPSP